MCAATLSAQEIKKIELLDADVMTHDKSRGENVNRVLGNVVFQHEQVMLYCDSAYMFTDDNSVEALGHVHIRVNDSTNIFGDSLRYDGNRKIAEIHNNVRMVDNQITLTTDHLNYNIPKKTATYYEGGKIIDLENTLTSKKGYYFSEKKDFFFKDSVILVNPKYTMTSDTLLYNTTSEIAWFYGPTTIVSKENYIYCERGWYDTKKDISEFRVNAFMRNDRQTLEGDSIYYERRTGIGLAYRNVTITDSIEHVMLKGNFAHYNQRSQYSVVTDSALMIQIDKGDSLFLHADTLKATFDTTNQKAKVLFAYNKAKFYRNDLQGMCDSLVYLFSDSTITLYQRPVIWTEDKQLTADTIVLQTANRQLESLSLYNSSFVIARDDSATNRYNQVKGVNLKGYFKNGELVRIYVYEKSETLYYLREDDGKKIGINTAIGRNLIINFSGNEITSISFLETPEGTMFPDDGLGEKEKFLRNFDWLDEHRPLTKEDIFRWL